MPKKTKLFLSFLMSVIILTFFLYNQYSKANNKPTSDLTGPILKVYFFDVGQGDSIFIRTPGGKDILIDGGPDSKVLEGLSSVMPFMDREIDLVVLTHPHKDHIDGLDEVLKRYKVGEVVESDLKSPPADEVYFDKLVASNGTPEKKALKGQEIFREGDLGIDVLYPFSLQMEEENLNDDSIVLVMDYKGKKFLFTGDATTEVEAKILDQDLNIDFLKVGHHGSRYSSSPGFLAKATPLVSIISVGEGNSFGHPTRDTLDRLSAVGSRVLRTDKNGTIEVDIDIGGEWQVRCSKGCG